MFRYLKIIIQFLSNHYKKIVLLITIFTIILYAIFIKQYFTNDVDNSFLADNLDSSAPIDMNMEINIPKLGDNFQNISFKIRSIDFVASSINSEVDRICIDSMSMLFSGLGTLNSSNFENRPYHFDNELCGQVEPFSWDNEVISYTANLYDAKENPIEISDSLYMENNQFYYPYDWLQVQIATVAQVNYLDIAGNIIEQQPYRISIFTETPHTWEWEATSKTAPDSYFWEYWNEGLSHNGKIIFIEEQYAPIIKDEPSTPNIIIFSRPIYLRLLFLVIIIALIIFVLILLITDSLETFLTGSIAILFGMFTTRNIFFPETNDAKTIIDVAYIGIYIVFATVVVSQGYYFISSQVKSNIQNRAVKRFIPQKINGLKRPSRIPLKRRARRGSELYKTPIGPRKKDK